MTYFREVHTSIPKNSVVKQHIAYYYFMQTADVHEPFEFSYYPHYYSTLNFFRHAHIELINGVRHVYSAKENNNLCIYSRNVKTVNKSVLKGEFNSIGVSFHPLGFHHFFPNQVDLSTQEYMIQHAGKEFDAYLHRIFMADSISDKTHLLDTLFEANYKKYEASLLKKAIAVIMNCEGEIEVQELCRHLGTNRRTLLRHFKQHLGYSIREFKAVVKFRVALREGVKHTAQSSSMAFDHNYYDQSAFIKYFKAKTSDTPKKLLPSLTQVSAQLIWKLP